MLGAPAARRWYAHAAMHELEVVGRMLGVKGGRTPYENMLEDERQSQEIRMQDAKASTCKDATITWEQMNSRTNSNTRPTLPWRKSGNVQLPRRKAANLAHVLR